MAERATPMHTLLTLTEVERNGGRRRRRRREEGGDGGDAGERVFKTMPPRLTRVKGEMAEQVVGSLTKYAESLLPERRHFLAQYRPVDVAFKVVGTGSVGLRDYCVLMEGNGPKDPLFLQIKEEVASGYAPYVAVGARKVREHQGRRVVEGSGRCSCSRTRFWDGRRWRDATTWCGS